jgi:hypothetical protein
MMGLYAAKNAVLVAAQLRLGNTATRLLLHMALECWDDGDNPAGQLPRRYFGGRTTAAIALGFLAPENGTDAAFRAVKRAVRELVDKGAIARVRSGRNGHTAEFELQLDSSRPLTARRAPHDVAILRRPDGLGQGSEYWTPQRATF